MRFFAGLNAIKKSIARKTHGLLWVGTINSNFESTAFGEVLPGLTQGQIDAAKVTVELRPPGFAELIAEVQQEAGTAPPAAQAAYSRGLERLRQFEETYRGRISAVDVLMAKTEACARDFAANFQTYRRLVLIADHNRFCAGKQILPFIANSAIFAGSALGGIALVAQSGVIPLISAGTAMTFLGCVGLALGIGAFAVAAGCAYLAIRALRERKYHLDLAGNAESAIHGSNNMFARSLLTGKPVKKLAMAIDVQSNASGKGLQGNIRVFRLHFDPQKLIENVPGFWVQNSADGSRSGPNSFPINEAYINTQMNIDAVLKRDPQDFPLGNGGNKRITARLVGLVRALAA